ncbi:MAG: excalibur calcium-binding domain-containing protein [Solirubrobacterales bacterium]
MRLTVRCVALSATLAGVLAIGLAGPVQGASKRVAGCAAFASQSDAQEYYMHRGGGPGKRAIRRLDPDRDGVACEDTAGPYAGYANLGYNKQRQFFYGFARMPYTPGAEAEFACLFGNRHFPDGPRSLGVYRIRAGKKQPIRVRGAEIHAQADPDSGRLVWKLPAKRPRGRYFAAFEQRIPLTPYGRNECPGFRSHAIVLPRPQ